MGRKHSGTRQYVYLCIAGLIFLCLISCAPVKTIVRVKEVCRHAQFLETLSNGEDFEAALKENQEILSRSPKSPPADEALFNMGLIYAHYKNPKKDYKQSLIFFKRVAKEFPQSALAGEAEMWVGVLEDIAKALQVDIDIEEKKKELTK